MDSPELKTVFTEALVRQDGPDRAAYLEEACRGDAELRAQVNALLRDHERIGRFMGTAKGALSSSTETAGDEPEDLPLVDITKAETQGKSSIPFIAPPLEGPSSVVGPYKLLQSLGEGGMGTVYMAEQTQPVRRTVALKLIKAGMDSRQVLARFGAERQALALMDHPNIAKVFDAGTTEAGRPYFVMELVKGIPITRFCDERRLTVRERLELAIPVCQAVQHAHQKGIIHRDLKPSNVLIALYDGKPVPKVIDFGVAKATGPRLTEHTLFTEFGAVVGTLEYMSPEQAELNQLDIDTRSDIYSLGVLLYELLTGSTPLERKRLRAAAFHELLRVIREEESPRPSLRLSSTEELPSIAACRHVEPRKLSGLVRGELDWIVMKSLEKDRTRRYETANGLASDLRRYLDDEPVQAGPPSSWYRLRKFARRNRAGMATAALVAAAVLLGAAAATWQAVRATRAESAALAAPEEKKKALAAEAEQRRIATSNEQMALTREAETKAVLDFVEGKVFAAARPEGIAGGLGYSVTLRKAVEAALPFVEKSFADQPLIEARLRMTLGKSFQYLGDARVAAEQYQAAQTIYAKHRGPDHPDTLSSMSNLADNYLNLGRYAEALKLHKETLALRRAKLGPDHPDTLRSMSNLASCFYRLNQHADALKLNEETLALRKTKLGPDHPDTLSSMNNLANSYASTDRLLDALKLYEETLALRKTKLGLDHPDTLASMHNLSLSYGTLGRGADALKLCEETLALERAKLGPDHPSTLLSMINLASSYQAMEKYADALKLCEEAHVLQKAKLGPDHPNTLGSMLDRAELHFNLGQYAEGIKLREETLAIQKVKLGADHADTLRNMQLLAWGYASFGDLLRIQGKFSEADRLYHEVLRLKPHATMALGRLYYLGLTLEHQGKLPEAEAKYREVLRLDPGYREVHSRLGMVLIKQGKREQAEAERKQALRLDPGLGDDLRRGLFPVRRFLGHTAGIAEVAFSPDGRTALSCSADGTMRLWELDTGKNVRTFLGHREVVLSVVFSRDGRRVLSSGKDSTVRFWDAETGKELHRFEGHSGAVNSAVLSSDGTTLVSCSRDNTVRWWDVETGRQLRLLEVKNSPLRCVALSSDDHRALAGGTDKIARVWDLATGKVLQILEGHTGQIWHVAMSPDGQKGLTAGADKIIFLWDLRTAKEIRRFQGHDSDVDNLVFSPDGKRFLSCGDDKTIRLWEVDTGKELVRLTGHTDGVGAIAISPDGRQALSGSRDTCICLGRLPE